MANELKSLSKPLDVSRVNLYEIQNLLRAVSDSLGTPPPTSSVGNAVEPSTVQERILDIQSLTNDIRTRLGEIQEFILTF